LAENSPNPEKEMVIQIQEAFRTLNRLAEKEIRQTIPFTITSKNQIPRNKPN
jgi:hypothetical protein